MSEFLRDPRFFNYAIMTMYALNSARWVFAKSWPDAAYWLCALGITATVTWGYGHR